MTWNRPQVWVDYVVGLFFMLLSGSPYAFTIYAEAMKHQLDYADSDVVLLATFLNTGLFGGALIAGRVMGKLGPKKTALVGGVMGCISYGLLWAAVSKKINYSVPFVCFLMLMTGLACIHSYFAGIRCFLGFPPEHHGKAAGLLTALAGAGPLVFGQIYQVGFTPPCDPSRCPLRDSDCCALKEELAEFMEFLCFFYLFSHFAGLGLMELTAMFESSCSSSTQHDRLKSDMKSRHSSLIRNSSLVQSVLTPGDQELLDVDPEEDMGDSDYVEMDNIETEDAAPMQSQISQISQIPRAINLQTCSSLVRRDNLLLLYTFSFLFGGAGLFTVVNIGLFSATMHASEKTITNLGAVWSATGIVCRLLLGVLADYVERTLIMFVIGCLYFVVLLIFVTNMDNLGVQYFMTALIGGCFGGVLSIAPLIVKQQFGIPHFGNNFGLIISSASIFVWLDWIIQFSVYDKHSGPPEFKAGACFGTPCYQESYIILVVLSFVAVLVTFTMWRTFDEPLSPKPVPL